MKSTRGNECGSAACIFFGVKSIDYIIMISRKVLFFINMDKDFGASDISTWTVKYGKIIAYDLPHVLYFQFTVTLDLPRYSEIFFFVSYWKYFLKPSSIQYDEGDYVLYKLKSNLVLRMEMCHVFFGFKKKRIFVLFWLEFATSVGGDEISMWFFDGSKYFLWMLVAIKSMMNFIFG